MDEVLFPTLYGKAKTEKIKVWSIRVVFDADGVTVVTTFGQQDGAMQTTRETVSAGKNSGRSNATTPFEQAHKIAQSKWNKQKDLGYCEQLDAVDGVMQRPMLAQNFVGKQRRVQWPWYGQAKLNGVRCLATVANDGVTFSSRNGKTYTTLDHLALELMAVFHHHAPITLDGELYHPELTLQDILRRVKREKTSREDLLAVPLQYWIYDAAIADVPFKDRFEWLSSFRDDMEQQTSFLVPVDTRLVDHHDALVQFNARNLELGFEGSMIRNPTGLYVPNYRSLDLLKYKVMTFQEEDFVIIGGTSAKGRDEGTVVFTCQTENGQPFGVRPKGSVAQRRVWLNQLDTLIGKKLVVRFAEWTPDGIPFHPTGLMIRDWE